MPLPPPDPAPIAQTSRRAALKLAMLGLAGAGVPVLAQSAKGFTHGVASGEPGATQVLLWTRYASDQDERLKWEVAEELTPASATSEWRFLASVRQKGTALAGVKRMTVLAGARKFSA